MEDTKSPCSGGKAASHCERCFAALGDASKAKTLQQINKIAEQSPEETVTKYCLCVP